MDLLRRGGKMKSKVLFIILALFAANSVIAAEIKPGEVIVKYKEGARRGRVALNLLYNQTGVKSIKRFSGNMRGFEHLYLEDSVKVEDAIAELEKSDLVEYAQPNYILRISPVQNPETPGLPCIPGFNIPGCDPNIKLPCLFPGIPFPPGCEDSGSPTDPTDPPPATKPALDPMPAEVNPPILDPSLDKTYGLDKMSVPKAWEIHKGSKDFVVAVIDTGIDYNHKDLSFNLWRNPNPTKNDTVGFDFVHNDGLPYDDNEHGTHTAGTIGAVGGNGIGVSGVNQRVSIMALKFISSEGSGTTTDAILAIDYAIEHGAKVLSNSWGGPADSGEENKALYDAIERAKAKDVLFIAAAGNDGADNDGPKGSLPAGFDNENLISVAATDKMDRLAFFSNYGKRTTHVSAPGVNVYSTVPGDKYAQLSGTSMACPHVAGAAALLWSKNPTWNFKKVKEVLMKTVDKLPELEPKTVTGGRINVLKALQWAVK
jgi:subtilisin family serine protease